MRAAVRENRRLAPNRCAGSRQGANPTVGRSGAARLATACFADAKARAICDFERRYVRDVLERAGGNLSLAARISGKERSRFGKLVRKYGLQHPAIGPSGAD